MALLALALAAPAAAYDTGPHTEITADAMTVEGFNADAVGVVQVNNWFVDLYEQAKKNPFSGHGGFWKRLLTGVIDSENWPDDLAITAFDSNSVTVRNLGSGPAGTFRLRVEGASRTIFESFTGWLPAPPRRARWRGAWSARPTSRPRTT